MENPLILEIINRFNRVTERHKITKLPIIVGRGYDSDIILDDQYISPSHVKINKDIDGQIILRDLDTVNGTHNLSQHQKIDQSVVNLNDRIRIGHTHFRLRDNKQILEDTEVDRFHSTRLSAYINSTWSLIFAIPLLFSLFIYQEYMNSFRDTGIIKLLTAATPALLISFLWAFSWAGISRFFTHHFYFSSHCNIACFGIIAIIVSTSLIDYYSFAFSVNSYSAYLKYLCQFLMGTIILYGHLRYCTTTSNKKIISITSTVSFTAIAITLLLTYTNQSEFSSQLNYMGQLKPPVFQLTPSLTTDEFFNQADLLKHEVDRLVE